MVHCTDAEKGMTTRLTLPGGLERYVRRRSGTDFAIILLLSGNRKVTHHASNVEYPTANSPGDRPVLGVVGYGTVQYRPDVALAAT